MEHSGAMYSRHRVSRAAIDLLKRFEGYRQTAAQLPDGRWTIGYGHTLTAREGAEVSEPDAEALLLYDLISVAHLINENTYAPISQNQFDALCSFAFNIGTDNFRRSQVLKRLNAGAMVQAACAMELWRKADFEGERIVVDALVRRRAAEKALFLTPAGDAWVPAPSPILRPLIDLDALDLVPARRPVALETSLEGDRVEVRRDRESDEDAELTPEDATAAVTAAAAAVTARLETLFADPGEEPEIEPEPEPQLDLGLELEPGLALEPEILAEPEEDFSADEPLQSDFLEALEPPSPELAGPVEPEPEAVEPTAEPESVDDALEIPKTPFLEHARPNGAAQVNVEIAPFEFIPARSRAAPRRKETSIAWDLLLILLGLAFFGFGVFWGLYAHPTSTGGFVTPIMVAWPAGVAGVMFVVVAVFRLLQRLGREAERD